MTKPISRQAGRRAKQLVTLVIATALIMQVSALALRSGPWAWPFTNYPMYASAHYENERIDARYRIWATFADGSEAPLDAPDVKGMHWFYQNWAGTMIKYDKDHYVLGSGGIKHEPTGSALRAKLKSILSRSAVAANYIDAFTEAAEERLGRQIVSLRIEDFPAKITRDGWVEDHPTVVVKELDIHRPSKLARD